VSFYNETLGGDIYPTPVLGMVGLVEDLSLVTRSSFRKPGDSIALVEPINRLVGKVNLEDERAVQNLVAAAIRDRLIQSAHDVSEGGLAVAVAECCYSNLERGAIGAEIKVPSHLEIRKDVFGEFSSCVLLTTNNVQELRKRAEQMGLKFYDLGKVGGTRLILNYESLRIVDVAIDELESAWSEGLPKLFT
jgi:phosphoribosylformylglycinamidine synthase